MSFGLRKLAADAVLSGAWVSALVLLAAALHAWPGGRFRHWARRLWIAAALLLYLLSTQPVSQAFLLPLERPYPVPPASALAGAHATVVLSGGFAGSPSGVEPALSRASVVRTVAAVRYHRQARTPLLLITGGSGDPMAPLRLESEAMRLLALELGVPAAELLTESGSRSSSESARASVALLRQRGVTRVLLVTSAFHLARSERLFRRHGLDVVPCPAEHLSRPPRWEPRSFVPVLGRLTHVDTAVHEYAGLLVDRLGS